MIDTLQAWYQAYATFTSENQFLGAAVAASVLATATFLLKSVPLKIITTIWNFITISVTVRYDSVWENRESYQMVASALQKKNIYLSRKFSVKRVERSEENSTTIMPDGEFALVIQDGWPMWFSVHTDGHQSNTFKQTLVLSTFGFSSERLKKFAEGLVAESEPPKIHVGEYRSTPLYQRKMSSVIMESSIKTKILASIDSWLSGREWYVERGIPYKFTMLLHGVPGCGKTSLIRALASHYGMSIFVVNVNGVSDTGLVEKIIDMPRKSILVLEDIDCVGINGMDRDSTEKSTNISISTNSLTMSGLLNALDGIIPLDEKIVIMTTNHIQKLDKALIRSGRCDLKVELVPLKKIEIEEFIELYFEEKRSVSEKLEIRGSDLQSLYLEHKNDIETFLDELNKTLDT
jgi:hypothetical protein